MRRAATIILALAALAARAGGQAADAPPAPRSLGPLTITATIRGRAEAWNWFNDDRHVNYVFGRTLLRVALSQHRRRFDWQVEVEQPALFGLPTDAAPDAGQPLGIGGAYFAASGSPNAAGAFVRQAFVSLTHLRSNGNYLRLGRFTFDDASEAAPADPTLAWLVRERISRRLLSSADSTVGRSFDGLQFSYDLNPRTNVTVLAARPTVGVYDVHGLRELNIDVFYGAFAHELPAKHTRSQVRAFAVGYRDGRNTVKLDSRPLALRRADTKPIFIGAFGGNYLLTFGTPIGAWDMLLWGALQRGSWGTLAQRAESATAEIGWQLPLPWKPWLRSGIWYASGDHDPADAVHGTFFQMLPSQRWYARLPFYAMQNLQDYCGQVILRPAKRMALRSEIHKVKLDDHTDYWYDGAGAFQPHTFGYTGVLSLGKLGKAGGLANYIDTGIDFQATSRLRLSFYVAALSGKAVMTTRPAGRKGGMAYSEFEYRF